MPSSPAPTSSASAEDARLTELEIKLSFQEDALEQLNQVVVRQQQQIDLLIRELTDLKAQGPSAELPSLRSLRDELPPHY